MPLRAGARISQRIRTPGRRGADRGASRGRSSWRTDQWAATEGRRHRGSTPRSGGRLWPPFCGPRGVRRSPRNHPSPPPACHSRCERSARESTRMARSETPCSPTASPPSRRRSAKPGSTAGCSPPSSTTTRSASTCSASGEGKLVTRRCYYLVPRQGEPRKLVQRLEPAMLDRLPGAKTAYTTWQEHRQRCVERWSRRNRRLAAQYSPLQSICRPSRASTPAPPSCCARRAASCVSAAELVQRFAATWSDGAARRPPPRQRARSTALVREAFGRVGRRCAPAARSTSTRSSSSCSRASSAPGCGPSRRPSSASTRTAPTRTTSPSAEPHRADPARRLPAHRPVGEGEAAGERLRRHHLVRRRAPPRPPTGSRRCWTVVAAARDAALGAGRAAATPSTPVRGFEVDDAPRASDRDAGYGERFIHRTGHSIGITDHGQGANMDNLETHDERRLHADDRLLDRARHLPDRATSACAARSTSR